MSNVDDMHGTDARVLIAGGGIGGLAAALCLHRHGFDVQVYEAVDRLEPLGVGINPLPHGAEVLHDLGLGSRLDETGIRTRAIEYGTRFGHVLASEARGVEAGFRCPQYSIHRGHLQMLLLDAAEERLGSDRIHLGHHLESFDETTDSVTARFHGASTATGERAVFDSSATRLQPNSVLLEATRRHGRDHGRRKPVHDMTNRDPGGTGRHGVCVTTDQKVGDSSS